MGVQILNGDVREVAPTLPAESVQCCVTSPPYWGLRDYGVVGQIGMEKTPEEYIATMVAVFAHVRRLLSPDGTLWINLGDSYSHGGHGARDRDRWPKQARNDHHPVHGKTETGLKPKNLVGIPWRVALALQADGWYLRSDIIWHKPNAMPEPAMTNRPTKAHEYIFLLSRSPKYYYDADAIKERASADTHAKCAEPGKGIKQNTSFAAAVKDAVEFRNKRSVWTVATQPYPEAHFATFPEDLVRPCILAGCSQGGTVLDPFAGSGTTLLVARAAGCNAIGIELNPEYVKLIEKRLAQDVLDWSGRCEE